MRLGEYENKQKLYQTSLPQNKQIDIPIIKSFSCGSTSAKHYNVKYN